MNLRVTPAVALSAALLLLAGCGSDDQPDGGKSPTPTASVSATPSESASASPMESPAPQGLVLDVTIAGDKVTPNAKAVDAKAGEKITLSVTSDRAGELHVHSTPEHEFEVEPGTSEHTFTVDNPGSVDIEEHESGALLYRLLVK